MSHTRKESSLAYIASSRWAGRGRLPVWVVRMRSTLLFMEAPRQTTPRDYRRLGIVLHNGDPTRVRLPRVVHRGRIALALTPHDPRIVPDRILLGSRLQPERLAL